MFIKNVFYKKPELHKLVTDRRQQVYVVKRYYVGKHCMVAGEWEDLDPVGGYSIKLPITATNVEECIKQWVDHCIIIHMLDHPDTKKIDTKNCVMERDELRKLILCGGPSPEYDIRGLKYIDDMVDLVNFILTI
jgi:hypothetical protein